MRRTYFLILCVLAAVVSCTEMAPERTLNDSGYFEVAKDDISLQWKISNGQDLEIILSAPTTGWVAVGFDPSSKMKDANLLLCAVVSGSVTIRDDYGNGSVSHSPDTSLGGTDDFTIIGGTETADRTEVQFTIPLNSGDAFDRALVSGSEYTVLLAYADADSFTVKHAHRTSIQITL